MADTATKIVGKNVDVTTSKPTGLTIERNGNSFKFTWKHGDYTEQQLQWKYKDGLNSPLINAPTISATATSKTVTVTLSNFSPSNPIKYVAFKVRGFTVKGGWSDWTDWKKYEFNAPKAPASLKDGWSSSSPNVSKFEWDAAPDSGEHAPIKDLEYQTLLKQDAPSDVKKWGWPSDTSGQSTSNASGSKSYTETDLAGKSWTRAFRMATGGRAGLSGWKYAYHTYAKPNKPSIRSASAVYQSTQSVFQVSATWFASETFQHPVDEAVLQYCVGVPTASLGLPSSPSWTEIATYNSTAAKDTLTYAGNISHQLAVDECLWLQAVNKHDAHPSNSSYSDTVLVYKNRLAAPSGFAITAQVAATHKVDLSCTNNSAVPDSKIAVVWQPTTNPEDSFVIGIIPHGSSSISGLQCPDWTNTGTLAFRCYAYVGTETFTTGTDGVKRYTITAEMTSDQENTGGQIPLAPATVTLSESPNGVGIIVKWSWTWETADSAEIAWSTNPNALYSTKQPETFIVRNVYQPLFEIADLDEGNTYYVWVRQIKGETMGPWSDVASIHLAAVPSTPDLTVSDDMIPQAGELTASWTYITNDGTPQAYAEVDEVIVSGGVTTYKKIAEATTEQHVLISAQAAGWSNGTQHTLVVRVTSESHQTSNWSPAITITVVDPLVCTITQNNLTIVGGRYELQALPLTVTVTGAGATGKTTLIIKRATDYTQARPDDSQLNGYTDEVVVRYVYMGEAQQTITAANVLEGSHLDDTAAYKIFAQVSDDFGQSASAEVTFYVNWSHQAVMPEGSVEINGKVAYITVEEPAGASSSDRVDIYRLSADDPELIYQGAEFDDVIVDPYPAIGEFGGYRLCLVTENGDYTTADGGYAWIDIASEFEDIAQLIDFGGNHVELPFNTNIDNSWEKDFTTTKYLGGSIEGDWLAGVQKSGTVTAATVMLRDPDDIAMMRTLAEYAGPVHIRTKDGSSYTANVNVSESMGYNTAGKISEFNLTIQRTNPQELDGVPLSEWEVESE